MTKKINPIHGVRSNCILTGLFTVMVLFIATQIVAGQQIKYEESYEKAVELSVKQGKTLAVLITIQPPVYSSNYFDGLNDRSVVDKFNSNFINYKADRSDTSASAMIIRKYKIYKFPSFLFIDKKGGLLFSDLAILSAANRIKEIADRAIAAGKEQSLTVYDSIYKSGNYDNTFLRLYIQKRESAGITDNSDLIEKYVAGLKVSDLSSYHEVLFILKAGPIIEGPAYRLAHFNKNITDSIYKTESLADRIAINNAMISNTMSSAIRNKSISMATTAANFARSSWGSNYSDGQRYYFLRILEYYLGVKDTARYLQQASMVYDNFYMNISIDSVRKRDSLNLASAKKAALENARQNGVRTDGTIKISVTYAKDAYVTELNNAAWNFYLMAGEKTDYLFRAMMWSRRTVEMTPKPEYYDTYAHLLYKLKFYDEAESMQRKAIESGKTAKADTRYFEEEYAKIRKRNLD